jgi:Ran GTPase-activating protein (RanGAP) involved in mRNA processing and transport
MLLIFQDMVISFLILVIGDDAAKIVAENIAHKNCKVKELKLTKSSLTDEGASIILKALENNSSIHSINLAKNSITDKFIDVLINCLKINKTIKTLYFINNHFTANCKEKIKSSFKNNIKIFI